MQAVRHFILLYLLFNLITLYQFNLIFPNLIYFNSFIILELISTDLTVH